MPNDKYLWNPKGLENIPAPATAVDTSALSGAQPPVKSKLFQIEPDVMVKKWNEDIAKIKQAARDKIALTATAELSDFDLDSNLKKLKKINAISDVPETKYLPKDLAQEYYQKELSDALEDHAAGALGTAAGEKIITLYWPDGTPLILKNVPEGLDVKMGPATNEKAGYDASTPRKPSKRTLKGLENRGLLSHPEMIGNDRFCEISNESNSKRTSNKDHR